MSLARKKFTEFKEQQPATIQGMLGEWRGASFSLATR